MELTSPSGLRAAFDERGTLLGLMRGDIAVNLFLGNALEGGPTNLVLRRHGSGRGTPLLGPRSPTRWRLDRRAASSKAPASGAGCATASRSASQPRRRPGSGTWRSRTRRRDRRVDLIYPQDLALAPYAAVRINEYYVSQYIDHTPLDHRRAARDRVAPEPGRRRPQSVVPDRFADRADGVRDGCAAVARTVARADRPAPALSDGLPSPRLQHEHAMAALQDADAISLPGERSRSASSAA